MNKNLLIIGVAVLLICVWFCGCNEYEVTTKEKDTDGDGEDNAENYPYNNTNEGETRNITIYGENVTQTINELNKSIILIVSGINCYVTVSQNTTLVEIILSGNYNLIRVSKNHKFTANDSGVGNEIVFYDYSDPIVQRAEPYIEKIFTNDSELKAYANSIISDCNTQDKECQINAIYRYILENYEHVNDPVDSSVIQTPHETIRVKSGNCAELSILINSLLENIGIKTYLVFTEEHIYSMANNIDPKKLWNYVESSLISQVEKDWGESILQTYKDDNLVIKSLHMWYYGGENGSSFGEHIDYLEVDYQIDTDQQLHFLVVPSWDDFISLSKGKEYTSYPDWEKKALISILNTIELDKYGGFILINEGLQNANVSVDFKFHFIPSFYKLYSENDITNYVIDNISSVILDPTLDDYGFPGYDRGIDGEKIAIDPLTKVYHYL